MIQIVFQFADGDSRRDFNSTFDAFCEILQAFQQCEEYFIGARLPRSKKAEYISILDVEAYVNQVGPVKDYLEIAAISGFNDTQIREEIRDMFFMDVPQLLPSWKQHMEEYMKEFEEYMLKHRVLWDCPGKPTMKGCSI